MDKTNVMRLLDLAGVAYEERVYSPDIVDGVSVAESLGEDPFCVFKTLVTENQDHVHFVFCVPVNGELDLKKAAKAVGAKSIAMIHQKELLPLTGYVHGGCSPIGMKKKFSTVIDGTAIVFDKIFVSGGRKGFQVGLDPNKLAEIISANFVDIQK